MSLKTFFNKYKKPIAFLAFLGIIGLVAFIIYFSLKKSYVSKAINPNLPSPRFLLSDDNGNISIFQPNNNKLNSNLSVAGDISSDNNINGININGTNINGTNINGTNINSGQTFKLGGTIIDENMLKRMIASTNIIDNRGKNELPNWYRSNYSSMTIKQFTEASSIGINNGSWCVLETMTPWIDTSGGYCFQFAYCMGGNGKIFYRYEDKPNSWSTWYDISDIKNVSNFVSYGTDINFFNEFSSDKDRAGRVYIDSGYFVIRGTGSQDPAVVKIRRN